MNLVQGFVHLYHIWGLFGAITMLIYGRSAYRNWREAGGTWRRAPCDIASILGGAVRDTLTDWIRFFGWVLVGIFGLAFKGARRKMWYEPRAGRWPSNHALLLGIALGGMARMFTALYWSERNTAWMTEVEVIAPGVFVIMAILADANHQITAWPEKPWRARLLCSAAAVWIGIGVFG